MKRRLFQVVTLFVLFSISALFITACDFLNNPSNSGVNPGEPLLKPGLARSVSFKIVTSKKEINKK